MSIHITIRDQLRKNLALDAQDEIVRLNNALRLLSKWRSVLIQNTLLRHSGTIVQQGPFFGLDFLENSAEGCHIAKLLGCYEQPLQPFIERAIASQYPEILNIGCAEGFYAVGLAKRMPNTRVYAYDTNDNAQKVCRGLAEKNGVANRIRIDSIFHTHDFSNFADRNILVICDIEGGERDLLDPAHAPSLKSMDVIVESHECLVPGVTQLLIDRFNDSHDITLVRDNGQRALSNPPEWFENLAHLDQLLATWEWRAGPTPWLVMRSKKFSIEGQLA